MKTPVLKNSNQRDSFLLYICLNKFDPPGRPTGPLPNIPHCGIAACMRVLFCDEEAKLCRCETVAEEILCSMNPKTQDLSDSIQPQYEESSVISTTDSEKVASRYTKPFRTSMYLSLYVCHLQSGAAIFIFKS